MLSSANKTRRFKRWRVVILLVVFAAVGSALLEMNHPEPSYADQPLSYWLVRLANEETSAHASRVLSEMGPEALPALRDALHTESSAARDFLYGVAERARLAPPRYYDAPNVRATAAYLLGQLGETAAPAIPDLIHALDDADPAVRMKAIRALSRIGMVAGPSLAQALNHPEPVVRYGAAKALGGMGDQARYATPALVRALNDSQRSVRDAAFQALAQIGERAQKNLGPATVPQLVDALTNSPWSHAKRFAVESLKKIGPDAKPALDALKAVQKSSPELALEIQEAVAAIAK